MRNLLDVFNVRNIQPPEGEVLGWKCVGRDLRTYGGFLWPARGVVRPGLPLGKKFTTTDPCPSFRGDGLCLARTALGAASGGIVLSTVLIVSYRLADVLFEGPHKIRVKMVRVLDVVDAWRVDLQDADLRGADLRGADLAGANLRRADLRCANLWRACLGAANLRHADLRRVNLGAASFRYADLQDADLRYARLLGACLAGADLRGANLRDARLDGADFRDARLDGTDLGGAS